MITMNELNNLSIAQLQDTKVLIDTIVQNKKPKIPAGDPVRSFPVFFNTWNPKPRTWGDSRPPKPGIEPN